MERFRYGELRGATNHLDCDLRSIEEREGDRLQKLQSMYDRRILELKLAIDRTRTQINDRTRAELQEIKKDFEREKTELLEAADRELEKLQESHRQELLDQTQQMYRDIEDELRSEMQQRRQEGEWERANFEDILHYIYDADEGRSRDNEVLSNAFEEMEQTHYQIHAKHREDAEYYQMQEWKRRENDDKVKTMYYQRVSEHDRECERIKVRKIAQLEELKSFFEQKETEHVERADYELKRIQESERQHLFDEMQRLYMQREAILLEGDRDRKERQNRYREHILKIMQRFNKQRNEERMAAAVNREIEQIKVVQKELSLEAEMLLHQAQHGDISAWATIRQRLQDNPVLKTKLSKEQVKVLEQMFKSSAHNSGGTVTPFNERFQWYSIGKNVFHRRVTSHFCDICDMEEMSNIPCTHLDANTIILNDNDVSKLKGRQGMILRGILKDNIAGGGKKQTTNIALKVLFSKDATETKEEMNKLMFLSHCKHFPRCLGHTVLPELKQLFHHNTMFVVMELATYGDLANLLGDAYHNGYSFPFGLTLQWMLSIAEALQAMHALYLKHLDVKPSNILLFDNFEAKLADFGLSQQHMDHHGHHESHRGFAYTNEVEGDDETLANDGSCNGGTLGYMAQENPKSFASDIFSFGMACVHIINLKFPRVMSQAKEEAMRRLREDVGKHESIAHELANLIESCVTYDPESRPTAGQCVRILETMLCNCRSPFTEEYCTHLARQVESWRNE